MSRIERHIEILLLENDCVIVPGLGGFVAHHITARYDEQEGLFLPPYRTLGFNPQLKVNDSLLAQSFVEAYDISFPEAMCQIEEEVQAMYSALEADGVIELNDLGKLRLTGNNKIEFEPLESGILTPLYYALDGYNFMLREKSVSQVKDKPVTAVVSSKKSKIVYMDCKNPKDKRISVSLKAVRNVGVAAVFCGVVMMSMFPLHNKLRITEEPVKSGVLYSLFDQSKPEQVVESKPLVRATAKKQSKNHYWSLVLASHITERNAVAFVKDINDAGFKGAKVYEGKGSVKVLYGNFVSEQEAFKQLNSLKDNEFFKEAWVIEVGK